MYIYIYIYIYIYNIHSFFLIYIIDFINIRCRYLDFLSVFSMITDET